MCVIVILEMVVIQIWTVELTEKQWYERFMMFRVHEPPRKHELLVHLLWIDPELGIIVWKDGTKVFAHLHNLLPIKIMHTGAT